MYTRTMEMAIVGFVAIAGGVILLAYTLFHMLQTKKVNMISRTLIYIYACIIAQSLCTKSATHSLLIKMVNILSNVFQLPFQLRNRQQIHIISIVIKIRITI